MLTIKDYFDDKGELLKGNSKLLSLAKNMARPTNSSDYLCPEGVCGKGPKFPAADPNGIWVSTAYIIAQAKHMDPKALKVVLVRLYKKYKAFKLPVPNKLQHLAAMLLTKKKEPKVAEPTKEDLKKKLETQIATFETKAGKLSPLKRRALAKELHTHAKRLNMVLPDGSVIEAYARSTPSKGAYTMMIQRTKVTGDPRYSQIPRMALTDIDKAIQLTALLDHMHTLTYDTIPDPVMALVAPVMMHKKSSAPERKTGPMAITKVAGVVDPTVLSELASILTETDSSEGILGLLRGSTDD
jgi:hypothetical protein